jgi:hypothetical protein
MLTRHPKQKDTEHLQIKIINNKKQNHHSKNSNKTSQWKSDF